jgi:hypothetical protein
VRPKYAVTGDALIVYRGTQTYVALAHGQNDGLLIHPDVSTVTPSEAVRLALPRMTSGTAQHRNDATSRSRRIGVGDLVAFATRVMGLTECGSCRRRHDALNRFPLWGWWRT